MPAKLIGDSCAEQVEDKVRGTYNQFENRRCGKPIYLDGVCANCWRMNEQLRGEFTPMAATGGVGERLGSDAYERLHIERQTQREKGIEQGIEHDVKLAMANLDKELAELLGE